MRPTVTALLLAACTADGPAVVALVPEIAASPDPLAFGERASPLAHTEVLTLSNAGRARLDVGLSVEGDDAFTLGAATAEVDPGDTVAIPVTFRPATFLDYEAELVLATNDADTPTLRVPVTGTGISAPLPDVDLDPLALDLGDVAPGTERTEIAVLTNRGTAPLTLGTVAQRGSGAFTLVVDPSGTVVAPGDDLPIVVRYAPTSEAGDNAVVTFPSDDPDEPEVALTLLGHGGGDLAYPEARIACPTEPVDPPGYVTLDGSGSTDPSGALPLTWAWRLAAVPEDANGQQISSAWLTSPSDVSTRLFADAIGTYTVELVVTNAAGVRSAPARCRVDAEPDEDLAVELTWNTSRADLDLHLARGGAQLFDVPNDVSWCNRGPDWGGRTASPRLDLDDLAGFGPETIAIPSPAAGDATVRVHHFDDDGDDVVTATIRVYVRGALALQASRNLARDEVWDAALVRFPAGTAAALGGDPTTARRRACR